MHPKLKAFMRTEAMDCEAAATQAPTSTTGDGAIDRASEPQEAVDTIAATPTDGGKAAAQATLPDECTHQEPCEAENEEAMKRRQLSRSGRRHPDDCGGDPDCYECDSDDEPWCSRGIAVYQTSEEEGEDDDQAESMEVELPQKSQSTCQDGPQERSRSMMACFREKKLKDSEVPSSHSRMSNPPASVGRTAAPSGIASIATLGVRMPLQPVTLASKATPPPSIPHTYTPSNDIDMDTGELSAFSKVDALRKDGHVIKNMMRPIKEEARDDVEGLDSKQGSQSGCLVGRTPFYPHNPFTLMRSNLPFFVKTEPGVPPVPHSSPLTAQTFVAHSQSSGMVDFMNPIASLPPMEALHCMQLEELMRMNLVPIPVSAIKQEPNPHPGMPSLSGSIPHSPPFYKKPELLSNFSKLSPPGSATGGNNMAKMYACQQCGATFKHRHHVVRHMRAHTGEKPFRCQECGATFARKCILTNHIRTHTGEKPYVCTECGDAFSRKHHLVIHRRTHTGEKPYVCAVCATAFARSHHLNRHLKTHFLMQQGHVIPPGEGHMMSPGDSHMIETGKIHMIKTGEGHMIPTSSLGEGAIDLTLQKMRDRPHSSILDLSIQKDDNDNHERRLSVEQPSFPLDLKTVHDFTRDSKVGLVESTKL